MPFSNSLIGSTESDRMPFSVVIGSKHTRRTCQASDKVIGSLVENDPISDHAFEPLDMADQLGEPPHMLGHGRVQGVLSGARANQLLHNLISHCG
jgi:hypothetical protein